MWRSGARAIHVGSMRSSSWGQGWNFRSDERVGRKFAILGYTDGARRLCVILALKVWGAEANTEVQEGFLGS
jgi:hypothetical protein